MIESKKYQTTYQKLKSAIGKILKSQGLEIDNMQMTVIVTRVLQQVDTAISANKKVGER